MTDRVLKRERVTGAFTSLEQFVESTGDAVAVGPILPGQIIQAAMFDETPVATSTGLKAGEMRIAVQLNDPNRSAASCAKAHTSRSSSSVTAPAIRRTGSSERAGLSIGATSRQPEKHPGQGETAVGDGAPGSRTPFARTIVSLAVNQEHAQKLIFAQKAASCTSRSWPRTARAPLRRRS